MGALPRFPWNWLILNKADRERAHRQREYFAQLEEESEPTSLATSTEGEHTIQVKNPYVKRHTIQVKNPYVKGHTIQVKNPYVKGHTIQVKNPYVKGHNLNDPPLIEGHSWRSLVPLKSWFDT